MLIKLFSLGVTAEALRANIGSKSAILLYRGPVDPKFQVEGIAPTNHSFSQKTRLNDLSYGTKIWTDLSSVLSQCTRLTDRQTDSFLIARPRLHCMQRGKNGSLNDLNRMPPAKYFIIVFVGQVRQIYTASGAKRDTL